MKMTDPIYNTVDTIEPRIAFHKSVNIDGGIVAKAASIGNAQCKLVVNDDGIYIVVPSRFDDDGNVSEINYRKYNLGAMIEAVQELNRRTAWMDTGMTFSESLIGVDSIDDSTTNTGAIYNNVTDLLPGLKQTVSHVNYHFTLVDIRGEAIRFYEITEANKGILNTLKSSSLMDPTNEDDTSLNIITKIMENDTGYITKYISPEVLNVTSNSFEITVLDTVDNNTPPTLSDKYYIYTPLGDNNYKASLKDGVTIDTNGILTGDNKIIPPVPYICTFGKKDGTSPQRFNVTSIAELFKDRSIPTSAPIDFSDWDFSNITDTSNIFEGCNTDFIVKYTKEGDKPKFIHSWGAPPEYVVLENGKPNGLKYEDTTDVNLGELQLSVDVLPNYIWKGKDGNGNDQWFRIGSTKDLKTYTYRIEKLNVFIENA